MSYTRTARIRTIDSVWDDAQYHLGIELPSPDPIIARYEEPNRRYHGLGHITSALESAAFLQGWDSDPIINLAIIFHDAIYDPSTPRTDEFASAALACEMLYPTGHAFIAREIGLLVEHTVFQRYSTPPQTFAEAVVRDADLAGFVIPDVCARNAIKIREEYLNFGITPEQFDAGRPAFLQSMLDLRQIYHSPRGLDWEAPARANIAAELKGLT